jgi:hypothetical protein
MRLTAGSPFGQRMDCRRSGDTGFSYSGDFRRDPNFAAPYSIGYLPPRRFNVYEAGLHNQSQRTLRRQSATGTVLASFGRPSPSVCPRRCLTASLSKLRLFRLLDPVR